MALSQLEIELSMNLARLQSDTGKATRMMEGMAREFKQIIGGVALGALVKQFADFTQRTIDNADRLNDLRIRTGLAGNELLVLEGAALRGGMSLETVSDVAGKLGRRLGAAELGTGEAARGFKALGIEAVDSAGRLKSVGEIMREAGEKFSEFEDGMDKATLAIAVFGKGGDKLIPVVESLAEVEARFKKLGITIDQEFMSRADQYNDLMKDIDAVNEVFARRLVQELLPALFSLREYMLEAASSSEKMQQKLSLVVGSLKGMALVVFGAYKTVAALSEVLVTGSITGHSFARSMVNAASAMHKASFFDFKGAKEDLDASKFWATDGLNTFINGLSRAKGHLTDIGDAYTNLFGAGAAPKPAPFGDDANWMTEQDRKKRAPKLPDPKADKELEKILEARQAMIENFAKHSQDLVKRYAENERQELEANYQDKLIDAKAYFEGMAALQLRAYEDEKRALTESLERQTEARSRFGVGSADYLKATQGIHNTTFQLMTLEAQRAAELKKQYRDITKAAMDYFAALDDIRAQTLELEDKSVEAARLRIDMQQADARRNPDIANNEQALADLDRIRELTIKRAELNQISEQAGIINSRLALEEERIQRSQKAGAIGQWEAMTQLGRARQEAVRQLAEHARLFTEIAENNGTEKMRLDAERLREELAKLKDSADVTGTFIKSTFEDAFANSFANFVTGAKSAKEAFQDFALSVIRNLAQMQAQSLAKSIFQGIGGGSGLFSGIGDWFSGLFKAEGGPVAGGGSYIVGERGPELFTPGVSGNITANGTGGVSIVQNIRIDSRSDQATIMTAMQAAQQRALTALHQSLRRGGTFARQTGIA